MMFQSLDNWLNEIGEASVEAAPFEYTGIDDKFPSDGVIAHQYEFKTLNDKYIGIFIVYKTNQNVAEYHFNREGKDGGEIVNKGDMFTVMSTNVAIIKDFIEKMDIKAIIIQGDKDLISMQQRLRLYDKFLRKHLPEEWGITTDNDRAGNIERIIFYDYEWSKTQKD